MTRVTQITPEQETTIWAGFEKICKYYNYKLEDGYFELEASDKCDYIEVEADKFITATYDGFIKISVCLEDPETEYAELSGDDKDALVLGDNEFSNFFYEVDGLLTSMKLYHFTNEDWDIDEDYQHQIVRLKLDFHYKVETKEENPLDLDF